MTPLLGFTADPDVGQSFGSAAGLPPGAAHLKNTSPDQRSRQKAGQEASGLAEAPPHSNPP